MAPHVLRVVTSILIATLLYGCGESSSDRPETAPRTSDTASTPSDPPSVGPGPSFKSTKEVARALKEGGLACTGFTILDQKDPSLKEFALCDVGGEERRLDIYLFENERNRDQWMGSIVQSGFPWIFGPNWIIVGAGDPATAEQRVEDVQRAIGGQIPVVEF